MKYDILKPWLSLDDWQKKYIETEGNCFLLCGRQVGKSTAASIKFGKRAAKRPNRLILMIAYTEKQAYNLFFKTLQYLQAVYPMMLMKGKDRPTQHIIKLRNGSKIMCFAAGTTGLGLVGYTITDLVIDEAAAMNREIFIMLSPTLSVTGGSMDLLSTPRGKEGFFYECSDDYSLGDKILPNWTRFYVSAEDCPRHSKEFLDQEKVRLTSLEYAQEYLARFLDEFKRVFSDELIKRVCSLSRSPFTPGKTYFMGVDVARLGKDLSTFEILEKVNKDYLEQKESLTTEKTRINQTISKILELEERYKFKRIYIDDGGVGGGVFDYLLTFDKTRNKVEAINNSSKSLTKDDKHRKKILKEDLYNNLLVLMEQGKIKLLDDADVKASLASVQYEDVIRPGKETFTKIYGNDTHIAEGIIRAAWCIKDKHLNIWIW